MRAYLAFLVLMLLFAMAIAQKEEKPRMLGSFLVGDYQESLYRLSSKIADLESRTDGKFVVRICSRETLANALAVASGRPYEILKYLERSNVEISRVFFSRFSGCGGKSGVPARVEYWVVPTGAKLETDEMIPAKELKVEYIAFSGKGRVNYRRFLETVSEKLENESTSTAFILTSFRHRQSAGLKQNALDAKKILTDRTDGSRVKSVKLRLLTTDSEAGDSDYPFIVLVSIQAEH